MRYLYTYLPKGNTAKTEGILSTRLAPEGWEKYKERSGMKTKADVLKWLDSLVPGFKRSNAISVLTEPIPEDADPDIRAFADAHELYAIPEYKELARLALVKAIRRINLGNRRGTVATSAPHYRKLDWKNIKPGKFLLSNTPHYILETTQGKIPAEYVYDTKQRARQLLKEFADRAVEEQLPIFAVTEGASVTRNNGSAAVRAARESHAKWEKAHGGDPDEDWGVKKQAAAKPIAFPEDEIPGLKDKDRIITTRVSRDFSAYNQGDEVKTPWGDLYEVEKRDVLNSLQHHPYLSELTEDQKRVLSKYRKLAVLSLLKKRNTLKKAASLTSDAKRHYPAQGSHGWNHIEDVLANAKAMVAAAGEKWTPEMEAAVMYHDTGLYPNGIGSEEVREGHELRGAEIARKELAKQFAAKKLKNIAAAIAEHRGSYKGTYTSKLSDLVSSADRGAPDLLAKMRRSYQYHIENKTPRRRIPAEVVAIIKEKYGQGGYARFPEYYKKLYSKELAQFQQAASNLTQAEVRKQLGI